MMLKKSQETRKIIRPTGTIFLLGALAVGAVLPVAVFACDVTSVTLYIGETQTTAQSHNTSTVYRPSGNSFWFDVHWSAATPDNEGFNLIIYDVTTSETLTTRNISSSTQRTYTGSTMLQTYSFVPHTIKAKVRRKPDGEWFSSPIGRTLTVFKVDIDTPASFPAYVAVDETLQLGSTVTHSSAGGGTYSWSKDSGPGTVTFDGSTDEDPTFSADTAGAYTVKAEYTKNGGTVEDECDVHVVESESLVLEDRKSGDSTVDETNDDPPPPDTFCVTPDEDVDFWIVDPESGATYPWEIKQDGDSIGSGDLDSSNDYTDEQTQGLYPGEYSLTVTKEGDGDFERKINFLIVKIVIGPVDLWWFNGENPANYDIAVTLTAAGATTGTFQWDVITGISKVNLNNGGADSDSITATDDNTITLKSTAASDVMYDVAVQVKLNGIFRDFILTDVLAPDSLTHLFNDDEAWSDGYMSHIHYCIKDQFDTTLQYSVEINEDFTTADISDYPYETWTLADEESGTVDPFDWDDGVGARLQAYPTCQNPQNPLGTTKIDHWDGDWYIGSLTTGSGVNVKSLTWQEYRDHARHE